MENINLIGSEDVRRAGQEMSSAAADMNRAAGYMNDVFERQQRFMDDWLMRFEGVINELKLIKG